MSLFSLHFVKMLYTLLLSLCLIITAQWYTVDFRVKCVLCVPLADQREGSGGDQDLTVEANGGADRGARPDLLYL